jgi:antirestriction protein ArdC
MSQPIYQLVTDRILALLERGVVPWKKPWKTPGLGLAASCSAPPPSCSAPSCC